MSAQFEGRRYAIELKRNEATRKGIVLLIIGALILVPAFYDRFVSTLPINQDVKDIIISLAGVSILFGAAFITNPLSNQDRAFFEIVEALKILEKTGRTPSLNQRAYKRILKAYKALRSLKTGKGSWYFNIKDKEKVFITNLKDRVAPAILEDKLPPVNLADIAIALQGSDIRLLENVNKQLEKQLKSKEKIERNITEFFTSRISTLSGALFFSFFTGILIPLVSIYIGTLFFKLNYILLIKENLVSVIAVCIGTSLAILAILRRKI